MNLTGRIGRGGRCGSVVVVVYPPFAVVIVGNGEWNWRGLEDPVLALMGGASLPFGK